ncbi:MAG: outer membrane beta-barrel protein [Granulosicoccus sp.]
MKNLTITLTLLCTASVAFAAAPVHAEARFAKGPFVGLSVGGAGIMPRSIGLAETGESEHDNGTGKLAVGYWFSPHWGVAASYVDMGEFTQTYTSGSFRGSIRSAGLGLLGRVAFNDRWNLIGKMTLTHNRTKQTSVTGNPAQFSDLSGESTQVVWPGLEINYKINEAASVFLEAESRGKAAEKLDTAYAGIGLRWQF